MNSEIRKQIEECEDDFYVIENCEKVPNELTDEFGNINGTLLLNGDFVGCLSTMAHGHMNRILSKMGFEVDSSEQLGGDDVVHISGSQVSGLRTHTYEDADDVDGDIPTLTNEQIEFLFNNRHQLESWDLGKKIPEMIRKRYNKIGYGAKWSNLQFLKDFYSHKIHTPKTDWQYFENSCLRTSPYYSLPGILDSEFEFEDADQAYQQIMKKFEKYRDLVKGNELWIFFQEFIPGINGVCSYTRDDGFNLKASSNLGDIVKGNDSQLVQLNSLNYDYLYDIAQSLSYDLRKDIQLEFVVTSNNKVYIVQLRPLESTNIKSEIEIGKDSTILTKGTSFTQGKATNLNQSDILVVDQDSNPEELTQGYSALVVKNNVEFAHILALSRTLKIPAMYNTSDFEFPSNKKFDVLVDHKYGYITY